MSELSNNSKPKKVADGLNITDYVDTSLTRSVTGTTALERVQRNHSDSIADAEPLTDEESNIYSDSINELKAMESQAREFLKGNNVNTQIKISAIDTSDIRLKREKRLAFEKAQIEEEFDARNKKKDELLAKIKQTVEKHQSSRKEGLTMLDRARLEAGEFDDDD